MTCQAILLWAANGLQKTHLMLESPGNFIIRSAWRKCYGVTKTHGDLTFFLRPSEAMVHDLVEPEYLSRHDRDSHFFDQKPDT